MSTKNLRLLEAFTIQEIRDIPHDLQRVVEVILVVPGSRIKPRYLFDPQSTSDDDGDIYLAPSEEASADCSCCSTSGRWVKEDLGSGGTSGGDSGPDDDSDFINKDGSVDFTGDQSMGGNKITDLADPTTPQGADTKAARDAAIAVEAAARAAADTAEATARAAADTTLSSAITAEAAARAAADALLTPKSRVLNGTAPIRIDGGASGDLSADRTISVNDADAINKGIVKLANDLGGTAALPKVVAITETGGPTQLVIGAIADGEVAKRSGGTLVGQSRAGIDTTAIQKNGSVAMTGDLDMGGKKGKNAADGVASSDFATVGQMEALIDGITGATPLALQYRRPLKSKAFLATTLASQDFGGTGVSVVVVVDESQEVTITYGGSIDRVSGSQIWKGKMGIRITCASPSVDLTKCMSREDFHIGAGDDTANDWTMGGHHTLTLAAGTYTFELYWGRIDSDSHNWQLLGESDGYEAGLTVEYTNLQTAIGYTSNRTARLYNSERLY